MLIKILKILLNLKKKMNIKKSQVVNHNNKWVNLFLKDLKVHKIQEQILKIYNKWHRRLHLLIHNQLNNK